MDIGNGLVTKIVDEGKLNEATRSGITPDLLDNDSGAVFNYINRHFTQYKSVPSRDAVQKAFPNFEFSTYTEPLEYFIETIKDTYRRNVLDEAISEAASLYVDDTKAAEGVLRSALSTLHTTQQSFKDIDLAESALDRRDQYLARKQNPGADGILSNWSKLDYQTLGWHEEEFIVLVGEKYIGKSWAITWLAVQAMLQGENVLIATREMGQYAIARRFDAIYSQVCFDSLRRGELSNVEEERYKEKMEELHNSSHHLTIARQGIDSVQDIQTKAVETDATIVFADSVYLWDAESRQGKQENEVKRRMDVSHKCKEIATGLGIPVIVSVQAGRKKVKSKTPDLDDIEWSNAFSQDADAVFFLDKDELDRELHRAHIWLLKSRDGDLADFFINQDFTYMDFKERDDESAPRTQVFEEDEEEGIFAGGE